MTRVHVVVEGQTEESFVKDMLSPFLWAHHVYPTAVIIGRPGHKGGRTNYSRVKGDVLRLLKQDRSAFCSTMLDLYGLGQGFPGMPLPAGILGLEKVVRIEEAVKADFVSEVPELRPDLRFIPYLQLHEYEGLLFSDPAALASGIGQPHLARQFQNIRDGFPTPEDINDNFDTAPSTRVLRAYRTYRKVLDGILAARCVGIERMRQECPHFRNWIQQLEALSADYAGNL